MSYVRRTELTCTETEFKLYGDKILLNNELLSVIRSSGRRDVYYGDGVTSIKNLKPSISYDELANLTENVKDNIREAQKSQVKAEEAAQAANITKTEAKNYVESKKASFVSYNKRETDTKYANALINTVTGTGSITVTDAYPAPVLDLAVYGASRQDGEPSPANPVEIVSVNVEEVVSSIAPGDITNATKATMPVTLRGIGNVRDKMDCRDGVWGVERYRYKILVDGNTIIKAINLSNPWDVSYPTAAHAQLSPLPGWKIGQANFLSNKLQCTTELDRDFGKTSLSNHTANDRMYLFIEHTITGVQPEDDTTTKLQKINSWIQNNNFTIEYELAEPVWESLPDDLQQQLNNLLIYSGDTACVYVTGSEIAPEMAVDYVMDTNKAIQKLKTAIIALGGNK